MGVQIGVRQAVHPARIHAESVVHEFFYATEAVQVLGIPGIEYRQLRQLLAVVRGSDELDERTWARFSLADIAGLEIAIALIGGPAVFSPGRRMQLRRLREALSALRVLGFRNPLIEVPLELQGGRIVARVRGVLLDPKSGQGVLVEIEERMEQRAREAHTAGTVARLRADLARLKRSQPTRGESNEPARLHLT